MKYAHKVIFSVFIKPEDTLQDPKIEDNIKEHIRKILPFKDEELEKEKIDFETEKVEGFNNRTIKIIRLNLIKDSMVQNFIKKFLSLLNSDQKSLLLRQKESRLDETLDFFLRLGKQEFLRDDIYITDSGDCIHMKISIAAFPKKRDAALKVLDEMFA